jgi:hypothetical protein
MLAIKTPVLILPVLRRSRDAILPWSIHVTSIARLFFVTICVIPYLFVCLSRPDGLRNVVSCPNLF